MNFSVVLAYRGVQSVKNTIINLFSYCVWNHNFAYFPEGFRDGLR
jgi:hypothetical protein